MTADRRLLRPKLLNLYPALLGPDGLTGPLGFKRAIFIKPKSTEYDGYQIRHCNA